jgi:hypothetical protein
VEQSQHQLQMLLAALLPAAQLHLLLQQHHQLHSRWVGSVACSEQAEQAAVVQI